MKNEKQGLFNSLSDSFGYFAESLGFKKIHGRIWLMIYLGKYPVSTTTIINNLKMSKASISLAIKDLLQHKLIEPGEKMSYGTQTYTANQNVINIVSDILRSRELKRYSEAETYSRLLQDMPSDDLNQLNISKEKTKTLLSMMHTTQKALNHFLKKDLKTIEDWTKYFNP